jgi:hypothetical protein
MKDGRGIGRGVGVGVGRTSWESPCSPRTSAWIERGDTFGRLGQRNEDPRGGKGIEVAYIKFLGQHAAQPDRVEHRPGADDLCGGQARALEREAGEDVDWVGDDEEHGVRAEGLHAAYYGVEDRAVARQEGEARLPFFSLCQPFLPLLRSAFPKKNKKRREMDCIGYQASVWRRR